MPKVLCTLPNASEEIGGIKFFKHTKGMLSEALDDAQAARLASIPGYEIVGGAQQPDDDADDKDAARVELLARAEAIGFKVKGNWSVERLRTEVEQAEKANNEGAQAE